MLSLTLVRRTFAGIWLIFAGILSLVWVHLRVRMRRDRILSIRRISDFWKSAGIRRIRNPSHPYFGTNRKRVCDFLLVINSNYGPILHHFWDMATYWLKIVVHRLPLLKSTVKWSIHENKKRLQHIGLPHFGLAPIIMWSVIAIRSPGICGDRIRSGTSLTVTIYIAGPSHLLYTIINWFCHNGCAPSPEIFFDFWAENDAFLWILGAIFPVI